METVEIPAWDSKPSFSDKKSQMSFGGIIALFHPPLISVIFLNERNRILEVICSQKQDIPVGIHYRGYTLVARNLCFIAIIMDDAGICCHLIFEVKTANLKTTTIKQKNKKEEVIWDTDNNRLRDIKEQQIWMILHSSSTLNQKVKELPELAVVTAGLDISLFVVRIYLKFAVCLAVLGTVFKGLLEKVHIIQSLLKDQNLKHMQFHRVPGMITADSSLQQQSCTGILEILWDKQHQRRAV
nr:PREDICTED: uncharacterized protein LOC104153556 [Struthio camelus australis]